MLLLLLSLRSFAIHVMERRAGAMPTGVVPQVDPFTPPRPRARQRPGPAPPPRDSHPGGLNGAARSCGSCSPLVPSPGIGRPVAEARTRADWRTPRTTTAVAVLKMMARSSETTNSRRSTCRTSGTTRRTGRHAPRPATSRDTRGHAVALEELLVELSHLVRQRRPRARPESSARGPRSPAGGSHRCWSHAGSPRLA